jgi:hypothetical protein
MTIFGAFWFVIRVSFRGLTAIHWLLTRSRSFTIRGTQFMEYERTQDHLNLFYTWDAKFTTKWWNDAADC